jgi:hypothetical protein
MPHFLGFLSAVSEKQSAFLGLWSGNRAKKNAESGSGPYSQVMRFQSQLMRSSAGRTGT